MGHDFGIIEIGGKRICRRQWWQLWKRGWRRHWSYWVGMMWIKEREAMTLDSEKCPTCGGPRGGGER
jgi:hypothetical protein